MKFLLYISVNLPALLYYMTIYCYWQIDNKYENPLFLILFCKSIAEVVLKHKKSYIYFATANAELKSKFVFIYFIINKDIQNVRIFFMLIFFYLIIIIILFESYVF